MSKNHPTDNIYSILARMDSLAPSAPLNEPAPTIREYEKIAAKGSILSGTTSKESKLQAQFNESKFSQVSKAIQKSSHVSKGSADAIAAAAGRKELGQKEMTRRSVAGRKKANECAMCGAGTCKDHDMNEATDAKDQKSTAAPSTEKDQAFDAQALAQHKRKLAADKNKRKITGTVSEQMNLVAARIMEAVNFKKMVDETGMSLDEMLECMDSDVQAYHATGDMSDRLHHFMQLHNHAKKQMADEGAALQSVGDKVGTTMGAAAGATLGTVGGPIGTVAGGLAGGAAGGALGAKLGAALEEETCNECGMYESDCGCAPGSAMGDTIRKANYEESSELEEELNTLARLAGLNVAEDASPKAKKDYDKDGEIESEKDEVIGSHRKAAGLDESEKETCEKCDCAPCKCEDVEEGNEFSGELVQARKQHKDSFSVGGKTYPVKEAQELVQMLKIAGLDYSKLEMALAEAKAQDKIAVDIEDEDEKDLANSPDPKYMSMRASTLNPGEGDNGEKAMHGDKPTFKNGDNPLTKPATNEAVHQLESKLAAEYESIKKVAQEGVMSKIKGMFKEKPPVEPSSNLFDQPDVKRDTEDYLKKSAKNPNGPSTVKNIFDDPKYK